MTDGIKLALPLDQQFDGFADELFAESEAVIARFVLEHFHALVDDRAVHEIPLPPCCRSSGARGVAEGVDVDESRAIDDIQRLLELAVGLAGKADNDVGRDRRPVEGEIHLLDHPEEVVARVLTIHSAKDAAGTTLKRQMKVRDDLGMGFQFRNQFASQIAGFQTAKPQAAKAGNPLTQRLHEF